MSFENLDDVIQRIQAGKSDAFAEIMDATLVPLQAYVCFFLADVHSAEDVLQKVYIRLFQEIDRYEPGTDFMAWARTIARFEALAERRRRQRKNAAKKRFKDLVRDRIAAIAESKIERYTLEDRLEALEKCLKRLPQKIARILQLRYKEKLSLARVGEVVGKNTSAVGKIIQRARMALADCVREQL